ncbi:hypothetical protein WMW72_21115 [Paenibacillus filicis]|uniref:Uncharacterized protein n=1 Tax=Paenibacillus filicis TaxID=669464 RepID=A0ABU9DNH0_9BACL
MSFSVQPARLRRLLGAFLLLPLLWSSAPLSQAEASAAAVVTIPDYTVKVNGSTIDNVRQRYPFLVYKDITYMPLTWSNTQALGIQADWQGTEGLVVYEIHPIGNGADWKPAALEQDLSGSNSPRRKYQASVAEYPIALPGGQKLDNSSEPYPFLEFRDVTYMPLTWRFTRELLQLGIDWDESAGLSITGGQWLIGRIFYDDADDLYAYPRVFLDKEKRALKISKKLQEPPVWVNEADTRTIEETLYNGRRDAGSQPVELKRTGNELYSGSKLLRKLSDEDRHILGDKQPIYEAVRFPIDDKKAIVSLHIYWPIAVIGPPPGRYYLYLEQEGTFTELTDLVFPPERVLLNPDGTVWIVKSYNELRYGPAVLFLLDTQGKLHSVNDKLASPQLITLGSLNKDLSNPAAADGSLIVQMADGMYNPDRNPTEGRSIYRLDTSLHATKLNYPVDGQLYMGTGHELFLLRPGTNTLIDLSRNLSRTWLDQEVY